MKIDAETCTRCGLCAAVCPSLAIEQKEKEIPHSHCKRSALCIECLQCMAICPSKSIIMGEKSFDSDFIDIIGGNPDFQEFFNLMVSRRSVRNFKNKPVSRELLEKIVEAIAQAPMGFPPHKTALTILQSRSAIEQMLPLMLKFYEDMIRWMKNPVIRYFIRRNTGVEGFATIKNHLIPILEQRVPDMKAMGYDEITRGAPALIILHAPLTSENHTQDANIALTYGLLAAHALGLGATAIGLISPAVNRTPELRAMLQIPKNHEAVAAMVLGYPRYNYQRGIKRELAGVHWM